MGHRNYEIVVQDADEYLTMLIDFNKMGALMRHVMTSALTNPQKYRNLMDPTVPTGEPEYDSYCQDSNEIYQNAVRSLPNPEPPDEYKGEYFFIHNIHILFWQNVNTVNILLCCFRMCIFTRTFTTYYFLRGINVLDSCLSISTEISLFAAKYVTRSRI